MDHSQKELLAASGVDLSGALERFMGNETLYENYLRKFSTNTSFTDLETAIVQKNWRDALGISHNLKGTAGSLGFMQLYELLCSQVTMLRQDDNDSASAIMSDIMSEYHRLLDVAKQII